MKFKKLVCMGMAAVLTCSSLPQITAQAQQIQEEAVRSIQSEEREEEELRREEALKRETTTEIPEQEVKQQNLQDSEIETEEVEEVNPNQEGLWYGDFQYQELEDGTLEIIDYKERGETEVIIPAEIEGKKVTQIGNHAFSECVILESISISKGVTSIGNYAFYGCISLESISIPEGVTSIGDNAFSNCYRLSNISLPEGMTSIGKWAFSYCVSLSNINLPEGVTSIREYAFERCSKLSSISLPERVTSIGEYAFRECSSLSSISLPERVTFIGKNAFFQCSLKEIVVNKNNKTYTSKNGILYTKDGTTLICYPAGKIGEVVIPKGVTSIGDNAFDWCTELRSISLPEGVTSIGDNAFSSCYKLSSINIPAGVTSIGKGAFSVCFNLTLLVTRGSYAETYAKQNNISYRYIGDTEKCTHNYTSEIIIEPSCNKRGIKLYTCTKCENTYIKAIPITDHTYQSKLTKATTKKNGNIITVCSKCGAQKGKKTIIYAANTIKLSKPSVTYNNKVQKPSITIKDSKGKALKKDKDYTVTYQKNMKNVGTYTITIQLKGNYKGNITKTFTITPKAVSITKITPKSKGFTVKWKKQTKQVTGYQISYSTSKKFAKKATKTKTISNAKATTKTISKLKAKKAYYIKIRTYKEVKVNGKMTKLYSNWSKVKTVTTKK